MDGLEVDSGRVRLDSSVVLRLVTWNVNSLKARLPRVLEWLEQFSPDIVCLQETKLADPPSPTSPSASSATTAPTTARASGTAWRSSPRSVSTDVRAGWDDDGEDDPDARLLWATCGGVRVACAYVPNGRSLEDDHYTYKLRWLERLRAALDSPRGRRHPTLAVCGDFNIAPDDRDVWSPTAFEGATHTSEPERAALQRLEEWGLEDVFRRHHDVGGLFSWWDYRAGDFHQGRGMRIDLVLATPSLAERSAMVMIDRNARKGKQPSDHAPVVVDFLD